MARPAMMRRSAKVWAQSGPTARAWNFCSQIVHALARAETNANGDSASGSRQRTLPRIHQMQRASTQGSITTEGLLSVVRMKNSSDKANGNKELRFPVRRRGDVEGAASWSSDVNE